MCMKKYKIRTLEEKLEIWNHYKKFGWGATFKKYGISRPTFSHWKERAKDKKTFGKNFLERKTKRRTIQLETARYVKQLHKKDPSLSLAQIRKLVCKRQKISRTTVWHILQGHFPMHG